MKSRNLYILAVTLLILSGCKRETSDEFVHLPDTGSFSLRFTHSVRDIPLQFNVPYINDWGETYTINTFKYYIQDISLINFRGDKVKLSGADEYFLVNEEVDSSKTILLRAPLGDYVGVSFVLGVDSARNVSGAQTGSLDPTNGMFWTWASGYVMAKLEGRSESSPFQKLFTYHIGGYRAPYVTIKPIKLLITNGSVYKVVKDGLLTATVNADADTWFGRINPIKIAENPACHSPGPLAKQVADNYEGMFSLTQFR